MIDFIAKRRELACLIEDIFDEFENDPTDCDVNTYLASKLLDAGYDKRESSEPVKRGRWLCVDTDTEQFFLCNRCKKKEYWESSYCPNCGAKMDEED